MKDQFQREIDYLRVSVTDRCNLRCRYCMPEEGVILKGHKDILSLEEIAQVVSCAAELGIKKVRLTGGEPLVRKGFIGLVEEINAINGIEEISLTTNGILLAEYARKLKQAGLKRVNISLDTMDKEKFHHIPRHGNLDRVWQGINAALEEDLGPVKLNVVVVKDFNHDEILDFASLTKDRPLHVRFIELMPIGESSGKGFLPLKQVKEIIKDYYGMEEKEGVTGNGPSMNYTLPRAKGSIGFIGALSEHFCSKCNRLRLTADGKLRPCLQKDLEVDLRESLRKGKKSDLKQIFAKTINIKPMEHDMELNGWGDQPRNMSQIGG